MEVITINAIILAAGEPNTGKSYFNAGADYLIRRLSSMGITAGRGAILSGDSSAYLSGIGKAYKEQKLIFVLTAPQPRNAATIAAVVAKGMQLDLTVNPAAKRGAESYAQRFQLPFGENELPAFSVLPMGAHAFENPIGLMQGYAVAGNEHLLVVLPCTPEEMEGCFEQKLSQLLTKFNEMNSPTAKLAVVAASIRNKLVPAAGGSYVKATNNIAVMEDAGMARTNLLDRLRAGKLTNNDKIRLGAVALFLVVFIGCMAYIASVYKESADNKNLSQDLKTLFTDKTAHEKVKANYPRDYLTKFSALYDQNPEVAGWINIPDTKVDYVVVQALDNAFYERRDFTRKDNNHGVPFVDYRVDQFLPSTNTVIYAHNMNDGQMFGELINYKQLSYYQKHPLIDYDSVYGEGKYKIFGIVLCKKDDPDFNYHNFIEKGSDQEMIDYVNKIRERSLINTKVDIRTDDSLLTLSTCDYDFKSSTGERIARFVVFARKVRPGESTDVDTAGATINTTPVMPAEWYAKLAQMQAAERKKQEEAQSSSQSASVSSSKWLTESESKELSAEERKSLAEKRESNAKKYLTYDEQQNLSLDDMLYLIDERKYEFGLYLNSDEQSMSISSRLNLVSERSELAREWLTAEEIRSAGKWSRIHALIEERKAAGEQQPSADKWLTAEELKLSASERNSLRSKRQAEAKAAGVTQREIDNASSWEEIQDLIASKAGSNDADKYIKDNPKWLNSDDKGLSLSDLKALVAERKAMASDAGIDTSKYSTWSAMQKAIEAAGDPKRDKLFSENRTWLDSGESGLSYNAMSKLISERKAMAAAAGVTAAELTASKSWSDTLKIIENKTNGGTAQAEANKYIADNPQWLNDGDKGKSLADLKALVVQRQAQAKAAGIDTSKYATWAEMQNAIKNPPTQPPTTTPTPTPPPSPTPTPPPSPTPTPPPSPTPSPTPPPSPTPSPEPPPPSPTTEPVPEPTPTPEAPAPTAEPPAGNGGEQAPPAEPAPTAEAAPPAANGSEQAPAA